MSDRLSATSSASLSRPSRSPKLDLGTVVTLSTIRRLGRSSPLSSDGSIGILTRGASTGFVVNGHTETDEVASKRSSWTMTTGRGLPRYAPRTAAV